MLVAHYIKKELSYFPFVIYPHSFQLINLKISNKKSNNGSTCNINISNIKKINIFYILTYYINIDTIIIHNLYQLNSTTIKHLIVIMHDIWLFLS